MFTGLPALGDVLDEVGLAAQERRRLQHVDDGGDFIQRRVFVHVGQHRHADLAFDLGEDAQAFLHAGAAETRRRGAIGLVETRLEDEGDAEFVGDLLQRACGVDLQLQRFDHTRAGNQEKGFIQADIEAAQIH